MKQWTVEYDRDNPKRSKVFFDDEPIQGLTSIEIKIDIEHHCPVLVLTVLAHGFEIENKDPHGEE